MLAISSDVDTVYNVTFEEKNIRILNKSHI